MTAQELEEKDDSFKQLDLFTYHEDAKKEPLHRTLHDAERNMEKEL